MRRAVWMAVASVVLVGVAFVTVFPTGTYLHQRQSLTQVQAQLAQLRRQDRALSEQAAQLDTNAEIARLARQDYGLVLPGQEAYAILPRPAHLPARAPKATRRPRHR